MGVPLEPPTHETPVNLRQTLQAMRRDVLRYTDQKKPLLAILLKNLYTHPALAGVLSYRLGRWFWLSRKNPLMFLAYILYRIGYPFVRMYSGLEISPRTQIGPGLCVLHFGPTVVHAGVVAGEDLTLMQGNTIGEAKSGLPRLGNHISLGTGAAIIGKVAVGDNVLIGAGAVVTTDLPSNCVAVGLPARPISFHEALAVREGLEAQSDYFDPQTG